MLQNRRLTLTPFHRLSTSDLPLCYLSYIYERGRRTQVWVRVIKAPWMNPSSPCGAPPCARVDLPAAPPGSSLALPLIYSLIHLFCCHMASLFFPLPSPAPSFHHPPLLPSLLLISLSCSSQGPLSPGKPLHPPIPPSLPLLPLSSCLLPPCSVATGPPPPCLLCLCCSSLPRSAQIRSCHRQRLIYP